MKIELLNDKWVEPPVRENEAINLSFEFFNPLDCLKGLVVKTLQAVQRIKKLQIQVIIKKVSSFEEKKRA